MKIAVTYDNGTVYQHFGHTKQFKIYTVEDNKVVSSETVDTGDSGHGALAGFLAARDVSIVICGNMGAGAQNALTEAGIQFFMRNLRDIGARRHIRLCNIKLTEYERK